MRDETNNESEITVVENEELKAFVFGVSFARGEKGELDLDEMPTVSMQVHLHSGGAYCFQISVEDAIGLHKSLVNVLKQLAQVKREGKLP